MNDGYGVAPIPVGALGTDARVRFIRRTYGHLLAAIVGFVALEVLFFSTGISLSILETVANVNWLLILGAFMIVGTLASRTAARARTTGAQYAALAAYVVAEAVIFVPLLYLANYYADGAIASAAVVTLLGTAALTGIAATSKRDFSFMRQLLVWVGVVAVIAIVASVLFGLQLGTWFSVAMVAFAGGMILYTTSNVLRHYPEDRYVSAALELFASVALMFWYVLRLLSALSRD
jgi:FtsH-binding integral membrane protein